MRSKLLHESDGQKTYALVFETGDEVMLVESPTHLRRKHDQETGLALIRL